MAALQIVGGLTSSLGLPFSPLRTRRLSSSSILFPSQCAPSRMRMGLKLVQTYDSSFELKPECQEMLQQLLSSAAFRGQMSTQFGQQQSEANSGMLYEFTGELFQPVPWSPNTTHGIPQAFEKYYNNPDYTIVNVPPNFMFKAKIFRPSRLCAIFKRVSNLQSET